MTRGWRTSEFWFSLAAAVAPLFAGDGMPPWAKAVAGAIAAAAYSLSRGSAKRKS